MVTHCYARESSCCHVLQQGEVGRKRFIADLKLAAHITRSQSESARHMVGGIIRRPAGHILVLVRGLGIWLGHLGRSVRCSAVGFGLESQGDEVEEVRPGCSATRRRRRERECGGARGVDSRCGHPRFPIRWRRPRKDTNGGRRLARRVVNCNRRTGGCREVVELKINLVMSFEPGRYSEGTDEVALGAYDFGRVCAGREFFRPQPTVVGHALTTSWCCSLWPKWHACVRTRKKKLELG